MNQTPAATELLRKIIRYAAILTAVCLASGASLSLLYVANEDRIREKEKQAFDEKLAAVMGDAEDPTLLGEASENADPLEKVYVARIGDGVRYAALGSAQGYQSKVVVLVSVDAPRAGEPVESDPPLFRVAALPTLETPGLGENLHAVESDTSLWGAIGGLFSGKDEAAPREPKRPRFQEQFSGKRLSDLVVRKGAEAGGITPITGATITSTAATAAVRQAVERIIKRTQNPTGGGEPVTGATPMNSMEPRL